MKLFRWAAAGASAYVIYKYSIGKKAKGEKVFDSPEVEAKPTRTKPAAKPAPTKAPRAARTSQTKPKA